MELTFRGPKLTVELTCHVPILHFQANEKGATLRASEVKPKFDRFLIEQEGKKNLNSFFLKRTKSLNYKMKIIASSETKKLDSVAREFSFYSNEVSKKNKQTPKRFVDGRVYLTIICFDKELQALIKKNLENFFIVTNFGAGQIKMLGSYTLKGTNLDKDYILNVFQQIFKMKKESFDVISIKGLRTNCFTNSNKVTQDKMRIINAHYREVKQYKKELKRASRFPSLILFKKIGNYLYMIPSVENNVIVEEGDNWKDGNKRKKYSYVEQKMKKITT